MPSKSFYLLGEDPSTSVSIEIDTKSDFQNLRRLIAAHFAIVDPTGIDLSTENGDALTELSDVTDAADPIAITLDGHKVREVNGPKGYPYVGNYYEIYPDHLGNHQRLFDQYGTIFKTTNMGSTVYETNDPAIAQIVFAESDFFTKKITPSHPLWGIKDQKAGVFLGDTDNENWKVAHKFLPPAFGPKAVRHYAPTMQKTIEKAFDVFDELDKKGEAWNVYQYMLKLGSQAVGKLVLGMDFKHFEKQEAPMHRMVILMSELLELNKKVTSYGSWYASLPFGDPKKLRQVRAEIDTLLNESLAAMVGSGTKDLELQEAALDASCIADYCMRAVDSKGEKLPKENLTAAVVVATGAGFTTTSSLLSWLIYGLVTYPDMQERLLQELVDNDIDENTQWTADITSKLGFLENYVKETQRRHNPSFQPGRTAKVDLILPGGYKIPEGSVVIPALHHIHNNPALWENPARFDPDRWNSECVRNRHKSAYIPFATGQRQCIGFNFALQEVKIFLPKLVYRYKFSKEGDAAVEYDPMFQLIRPVNLYVNAERRVKWPPKSEKADSVSNS
ncbi:putative cytochrome P450 monooxygenase [Aureobasidium sp. EXF-3400]|nr:putative cytochrome P450 monooxygenase [Aureobasidium sp. EXF-3400]